MYCAVWEVKNEVEFLTRLKDGRTDFDETPVVAEDSIEGFESDFVPPIHSFITLQLRRQMVKFRVVFVDTYIERIDNKTQVSAAHLYVIRLAGNKS